MSLDASNINQNSSDKDVTSTYYSTGKTKLEAAQVKNASRAKVYYDPTVSRLYFSRGGEIVGRVLVFLVQLLVITNVVLLSGIAGQALTEQIPFSPLLNALGQPLYTIITILIAVIAISFSFGLLITILLIKKIKSVIAFSVVFLILGNFLVGGLAGLAGWYYFSDTNSTGSQYNLVALICGGAGVVLLSLASVCMIVSARRLRSTLARNFKLSDRVEREHF